MEKSKVYFRAGLEVLRYRIITLSNSSNLSIPSISPFTEINILKLTYNKNPWKLEMNKWQRREVTTYCPEIADIKTDRGLTLINTRNQIFKEFIQTYVFLVRVGLKKTIFRNRQNTSTKRLEIYTKGRELQEFKMAMAKC